MIKISTGNQIHLLDKIAKEEEQKNGISVVIELKAKRALTIGTAPNVPAKFKNELMIDEFQDFCSKHQPSESLTKLMENIYDANVSIVLGDEKVLKKMIEDDENHKDDEKD